jgi:tetratricopeptide (TPR) repeat protein
MTDRIPRPNLRRARLRLGWSLERAADEISRRYPHLGIDVRQIVRWESGETRTPRPMNVLALSTTYGLPPEELDLPPIPGADCTWNVPHAPVPGEHAAAPSPSVPSGDGVAVRAGSTDGELVTLIVNRQQLIDALGGTAAAGLLHDIDSHGERTASVSREDLSPAERSALSQTIGQNIEAAWALFHTADTEHMLAVGRTQLSMLRRHHGDLDASVLPTFYSSVYRLLGATQHRRGRYQDALGAHDRAYLTALEAGDAWSMAESRAWRAYGLQALVRDSESLQVIEAALRLISEQSDPQSTRLRARLLASGATSAASLHDAERSAAMLHASEALLDEIPALHEEFDRAAWLADAGICSLRLGDVALAVTRLRQAVNGTPQQWVARHVLATLGLAGALACSRDRDETLAVSKSLIPRLAATRSRELTDHVVRFLREGLMASFPDDRQCRALLGEAEASLSAGA